MCLHKTLDVSFLVQALIFLKENIQQTQLIVILLVLIGVMMIKKNGLNFQLTVKKYGVIQAKNS
jgi:drug/metabolite transporter (DMT)-like permease